MSDVVEGTSLVSSSEAPLTDQVLEHEERKIMELDLLAETSSFRMTNYQLNEIVNSAVLYGAGAMILLKLSMFDPNMIRGWSIQDIITRIPYQVWGSYTEILEQSPIFTKAVTSATVYTIGDVISQRTEGVRMGELDRWRTARSALAGLIGHGPLSHYWYYYCDEFFDNVLHLTQWWAFFPKVIVDQATWGPFWNNMYILLLGVMKMESLETIWGDMKRTTIPLVVSGLKLWPLAHCMTYGVVPVENRLLWVDLVEIVWVTILATQAAGGNAEKTVPPSEEQEQPQAGVVLDISKNQKAAADAI